MAITGDKHIKNNVRKQTFRAYVANVGLSEFPEGLPELYVSLTGTFVNKNGIQKLSEVWYGLRTKLYKDDQIVSVDLNKDVVEMNKKYSKEIRCVHNNIVQTIKDICFGGEKISMIVLDFMRTPEIEIENVKEILKTITMQKEKCVVLMNFVVRNRQEKYDSKMEKIHERISAFKEVKTILKLGKWQGWIKPFLDYQFKSQPSRTPMKSIVLIKPEV